MSVTVVRSRETYTGLFGSGPYPFYFPVQTEADLRVSLVPSSGAAGILLHLGIDYTVKLTGSSGGTVTLTTPLEPVQSLVIRRLVQPLQLTDFLTQGPFLPASHQKALDRLAMAIQNLWEVLDPGDVTGARSPVLAETDVDGAGAYACKGNRLAGAGDPIDGQDVATRAWVERMFDAVQNGGGPVNSIAWNHTGDGGTRTFALAGTKFADPALYLVFVDGVRQSVGSSYGIDLTNHQLVMIEAPPAGSAVAVLGLAYPRAANVPQNPPVYTSDANRPAASAEWSGLDIIVKESGVPARRETCLETATPGVYAWVISVAASPL